MTRFGRIHFLDGSRDHSRKLFASPCLSEDRWKFCQLLVDWIVQQHVHTAKTDLFFNWENVDNMLIKDSIVSKYPEFE